MSEGKREFWFYFDVDCNWHPLTNQAAADYIQRKIAEEYPGFDCKMVHGVSKSAFDRAIELIRDIEPSRLTEGQRFRRLEILERLNEAGLAKIKDILERK